MEHAVHTTEKSKTASAIYTLIGLLFGAAIGGPFLWAMIILLNA